MFKTKGYTPISICVAHNIYSKGDALISICVAHNIYSVQCTMYSVQAIT